jgi:uncharacterized cysteine cluster protein YcgN (CxxCxxCC family)
MGQLRERFWELPLDTLDRAEWEALCDGCGRCCLHKLEDEDTGAIAMTNVACRLLDTQTARCCDYRRRAEDQPLPEWHPLLTGSDEAMKRAGKCVAGKVVSEVEAGPLEHHIVDWDSR